MKPEKTASTKPLPPGFLGQVTQVCVVTRDYRARIDAMLRAGIGPWSVYTFSPESCTDLTYHGGAAVHSFKVCLAEMAGMRWEIIQPLDGQTIYGDFLDRHGDGVQHVIFECGGRSWAEKTAAFEAAGFPCLQSGRWLDRVTYAYYATESAVGTVCEIVDLPTDWSRPEAEEIYSAE